MGAQCCADETVKRDIITKLESDIMVPITNNEYYIHDWPSDESIEPTLSHLRQTACTSDATQSSERSWRSTK